MLRTDERTYPSQTDAEQRLVEIEADMLRGQWVDPDAGKITLTEYAERWIDERDLEARSAENYSLYLRKHIPALGPR